MSFIILLFVGIAYLLKHYAFVWMPLAFFFSILEINKSLKRGRKYFGGNCPKRTQEDLFKRFGYCIQWSPEYFDPRVLNCGFILKKEVEKLTVFPSLLDEKSYIIAKPSEEILEFVKKMPYRRLTNNTPEIFSFKFSKKRDAALFKMFYGDNFQF